MKNRLLLYRVEEVATPIPSNRNKKYWNLEFEWEFEDGIAQRFCNIVNPNVLVFMVDMLQKLGHKKTERKIW